MRIILKIYSIPNTYQNCRITPSTNITILTILLLHSMKHQNETKLLQLSTTIQNNLQKLMSSTFQRTLQENVVVKAEVNGVQNHLHICVCEGGGGNNDDFDVFWVVLAEKMHRKLVENGQNVRVTESGQFRFENRKQNVLERKQSPEQNSYGSETSEWNAIYLFINYTGSLNTINTIETCTTVFKWRFGLTYKYSFMSYTFLYLKKSLHFMTSIVASGS